MVVAHEPITRGCIDDGKASDAQRHGPRGWSDGFDWWREVIETTGAATVASLPTTFTICVSFDDTRRPSLRRRPRCGAFLCRGWPMPVRRLGRRSLVDAFVATETDRQSAHRVIGLAERRALFLRNGDGMANRRRSRSLPSTGINGVQAAQAIRQTNREVYGSSAGSCLAMRFGVWSQRSATALILGHPPRLSVPLPSFCIPS